MKTKMNISKLRKGMVAICTMMAVAGASYAQPNPNVYRNDEIAPTARLDNMMNRTEQSIRFVAIAADVTEAQDRLNILADLTEASVKYEAPSAEEVNEIAPELERLDKLAELTESRVKYETPAIEVTPEIARLDMLASSIESALAFKAPAVNDTPGFDNICDNSTESILAEKTK